MRNVFVTADLHLGHRNIVKYRGFLNVDQMNSYIVDKWNSVVSDDDLVYVLGDVAFAITELYSLETLNSMRGRKILVMGNHDYNYKKYTRYFDKICGSICKQVNEKNVLMTHIPVHESQFGRFDYNIHGHLHSEALTDQRYKCVSVEQNNYTPFLLKDLITNEI